MWVLSVVGLSGYRLPLMCVFAGSRRRRRRHVYVSQSDGVDSCRYKFCVCDLRICVKVSQGFS